MPKAKSKTKKQQVSESSDDVDTGSDESDVESSTESEDDSDRDIAGQKSDEDGDDSDVIDIKDQYILDAFKPKPIKCVVSEWAKRKLRGAFLGSVVSKDERNQLIDDYFCSPEDWKLFSAPKVSDSPLALMMTSTSSALIDLTRIHNDLLFAMRVGLLSYERVLELVASWAKEKPIPETNKVIPAGKWANVSYRFSQNGFPVPIPHRIREDIDDAAVNKFLDRDIMTQYTTDRDKLEMAVRYALSYKEAFERMQGSANAAHHDAVALQEISVETHDHAIKLAKDTGSAMRVLGGVCQQIKRMREEEYSKPLEPGFKKFLANKKASKTQKENQDSRANVLLDDDLAGQAKKYGKIKRVMAGVSKTKKRKDAIRKVQAAQRKRNADGKSSGPSKKTTKKKSQPNKKGKGKGKKGKKSAGSKPGTSKEKDNAGNDSE